MDTYQKALQGRTSLPRVFKTLLESGTTEKATTTRTHCAVKPGNDDGPVKTLFSVVPGRRIRGRGARLKETAAVRTPPTHLNELERTDNLPAVFEDPRKPAASRLQIYPPSHTPDACVCALLHAVQIFYTSHNTA